MPLSFDFPLEKLKSYKGSSPRPADFDAYWTQGLAEMRAIDPQVELVPAGIETSHAECFYLYFTGVGGARVQAKYVRAKGNGTPGPAVLQFHGYSGKIGDWADGPMLAFAAEGISYVGMNCRGQGGGSQDAGGVTGNTLRGHIVRGLSDALNGQPQKLLFRDIFLDTAQLAGIVMALDGVDGNRVGAWGASQGGALTIACAALEPRIRRAAPLFPFLSDYRRVWEMDLAKDAYAELQEWFRHYDPLHEREDEVFAALGYIDIQNLAERVRGEVLWRIGLMDRICPPSTQYAAYNKLTAPKSMVTYPDFAHEELPGAYDQLFAFMRGL